MSNPLGSTQCPGSQPCQPHDAAGIVLADLLRHAEGLPGERGAVPV